MLELVEVQVSAVVQHLLEMAALLQVARDKTGLQHIRMVVPKLRAEAQVQEHQFLVLFSLAARRKVELVVVAQDFLAVPAVRVHQDLVAAVPLTRPTLDLQ